MPSPKSLCEIRVRYGETDGMGVVYYANYLSWFEVARCELLRHFGATYKDIESQNVYLPVIEARCRYLKPAVYDDLVQIRTRASKPSSIRLRFDYEVDRVDDGLRLAEGFTMHVAIDSQGKPRRLPETIEELLR